MAPVDTFPHAVEHARGAEIDVRAPDADTVFCGGRWPASLLAQMAEAADG